ncbi:hypothetical protein H2203_007223 [Taxawa tesnikishii (nom. ined.)]|nr:hypothetical protein H2203_007223 [Dothideales sp. JES 119]
MEYMIRGSNRPKMGSENPGYKPFLQHRLPTIQIAGTWLETATENDSSVEMLFYRGKCAMPASGALGSGQEEEVRHKAWLDSTQAGFEAFQRGVHTVPSDRPLDKAKWLAPVALKVQLYDYQSDGVRRIIELENGGTAGAVLGDDMGLGKTVTIVAVMVANPSPNGKATLLVVPKQLVSMWTREIKRHAPDLRTLEYTGASKKTSTAKAVRSLWAEKRIAITGTPVQDVAHLLSTIRGCSTLYCVATPDPDDERDPTQLNQERSGILALTLAGVMVRRLRRDTFNAKPVQQDIMVDRRDILASPDKGSKYPHHPQTRRIEVFGSSGVHAVSSTFL